MKKFCLLAVLGIVAIALFANPMTPDFLSRVWFDDTGDCHLQFGSDLLYYNYSPQTTGINLVTSFGTFLMPYSLVPPTEVDGYPWNINASALIPGFNVNPAQDSIRIDIGRFPWDKIVWGPGESPYLDMHPLSQNQAAVHVKQEYMGEVYSFWAKENGVDEDTEYATNDRCTFNIHVSDLAGNSISHHPVFFHQGYYPYYYQPTHYTDAQGNLQIVDYAKRMWLGIRDWNYNVLFEQAYFPEPDEVFNVNVIVNTVAGSDPVASPVLDKLTVYPNVLSGRSRDVHISYSKAVDDARLYLYDLKGRELAAMSFDAQNEINWQLPQLGSGVYFLVLKSGTRELGREKLILIK